MHYLFILLALLQIVNRSSQEPELVLPVDHSETIRIATFSPDGKKIITATADHTAKIWDGISGKLLAILKHNNTVKYAEFSNDNRYVITSTGDSTAIIWDAVTGSLMKELKKYSGHVRSAKFSRDGSKIVTTDGRVRIWEVSSGKLITTFDLPGNGFNNYAEYSHDEKLILIKGSSINIIDAVSGAVVKTLPCGDQKLRIKQRYIHDAHFSHDNSKVVAACEDNTTRVFDTFTGNQLIELLDEASVISAEFSPDGKLIATIADEVKLWDVTTGKLLSPFNVSVFGNDAKFSNDGRLIAVAGMSEIVIFNVGSGEVVQVLKGHNKPITAIKFSADDKRLISASDDGQVKLWDVKRWTLLANLPGN